MKQAKAPNEQPGLKGWRNIAEFLGQRIGVAQRWAKEGMPVTRDGRYVSASQEDLQRWLGRQSGTRLPVRVPAAGERDLSAELRRGLSEARQRRKLHRVK